MLADCPILAVSSLNLNGTWTDAFLSLLGEGDDRNEIFQLRAAGSTRSVRFLSEPRRYRYRNRWIVDVEFIIRDRGVWDIKNARREKFEIHLDLDTDGIFNFRSAEIAMSYGPSAYFEWRVNRVWRIKR